MLRGGGEGVLLHIEIITNFNLVVVSCYFRTLVVAFALSAVVIIRPKTEGKFDGVTR